MVRFRDRMRAYHLKFYVPILLLWGSVFLSTLSPVVVQSDIRLDPNIERNDLMRIDSGADIELDDIVIYRLNWVDYVGRIIGLSGDEFLLGLDGNSIIRNGERVVLAPRGFDISMNASGTMTVEDDQFAVYVQGGRRNPVILAISLDDVRGPVEKIYRYRDLGRADWLMLGFYSVIVLALVVLPYAAFMRQRSQSFFRIVVLVTHSFLTAAIAGTLLAASLPGDPLGVGAADPVWWWFPLTVVTGFNLKLLLVVAAFLALQWLAVRRPWRSRPAD